MKYFILTKDESYTGTPVEAAFDINNFVLRLSHQVKDDKGQLLWKRSSYNYAHLAAILGSFAEECGGEGEWLREGLKGNNSATMKFLASLVTAIDASVVGRNSLGAAQ